MDYSIIVAVAALVLSAIGFFYKIGRDTKTDSNNTDDSKLDLIYRSTETINKKLDDIADWQRDAAQIHTSHEERIKTLFSNFTEVKDHLSRIDKRLEDREILNKAIQKILERMN